MTRHFEIKNKFLGVFLSLSLALSVFGAINAAPSSAAVSAAGANCSTLNVQDYVNGTALVCATNSSGAKVWTKYFTAGAGGTVTIGIGALPASLEAYAASAPPRSYVVAAIYSGLTRVDLSTGTPILMPNAADSWAQEKGRPQVWVFNIIKGKEFPNGEPMNADAVKASLDYVMNPKNNAGLRAKVLDITKIEVASEYQVKITTSAPRYLLPRTLSTIPILPPKLFAEQGASTFYKTPVGTGPFKATSFTPGVQLTLEANPYSLRVKPSASKIIFKVIPEDSSRMAALRSGGVDVVTKVPTDSITTLKSANFDIKSIVEPATYIMSLMAKSGPLADKRVRQALNYAVNKQALIDGINGGLGQIAQAQLIPKGLTGFCESISAYPYDLDKANDLMKAAGIAKKSINLVFQSSTAYITNDVLMAQAISQMFEKLDAVNSVKVEVLEFSKFLDVYYLRGAIPRKDLFAWRMSSSPDLDALVQMERYTTGYPTSNIGYSNRNYDVAINAAAALDVKSTARTARLCKAASILKEDAPILWGIHTPDVWAGNKALERLTVDAGGNIDLVSIGNK